MLVDFKEDTAQQQHYPQADLRLSGRYMLPDQREFACSTRYISVNKAMILGPEQGNIDDRVIAYLEKVGRFDGRIQEKVEGGFILTFTLSPIKAEKLADQLAWLLSNDCDGQIADRRHERIVPNYSLSTLTLQSGMKIHCHIIDVSISGAAISLKTRPELGTRIILGSTPGRVTRNLQHGVVIEFLEQIPEDKFGVDIIL